MSGCPTDPESDSVAAAIAAIIRPIPTPKYRNEYLTLGTRIFNSEYPQHMP